MAGEQKKNKKITWTKEGTEALLDFYAARRNEFQHSRKKKHGYDYLLLDMVSAGYADENTTSSHLAIKIQTLIRAHKTAVDNNNQTGAAPCVAPFMDRMENLFGRQPIISHCNLITCGAVAIGNSPSSITEVASTTASETVDVESSTEITTPTPTSSDSQMPSTSSSSTQGNKRKMTKAMYLEKKLKMKEKESESSDAKWKEFLELQKQKEETRRQKIKLLEEYLKKSSK